MSAILNGQKGFWAKRSMDANPVFISVGGTGVSDADVDKAKAEWTKRTGYEGTQAQNNVQWVGDDPNQMYTDIATGNVAGFSKATPDAEEEDYFDNLLRQIEQESASARAAANQSHDTLVKQLKESRQLYDKDLERTYGRALEKANIGIYNRGVEDSGLKGRDFGYLTEDKQYQTEQKDLLDKQKQEIADIDLKQRLDTIARSEERAKFNASNAVRTYADYSYI